MLEVRHSLCAVYIIILQGGFARPLFREVLLYTPRIHFAHLSYIAIAQPLTRSLYLVLQDSVMSNSDSTTSLLFPLGVQYRLSRVPTRVYVCSFFLGYCTRKMWSWVFNRATTRQIMQLDEQQTCNVYQGSIFVSCRSRPPPNLLECLHTEAPYVPSSLYRFRQAEMPSCMCTYQTVAENLIFNSGFVARL